MSQTSHSSVGSWRGGDQGRGRGWRGSRGGWRGGQGKYLNHYGNRGRGRATVFSRRRQRRGYANSFSSIPGGEVATMTDPQTKRIRSSQMVQTRIEVASPYKGWRLYFPDEVYSDHSPLLQKVQVLEKYFTSWMQLFNLDDIEMKGSVTIDFNELATDRIVTEGIPDLITELRETPEKIVSCIGLAVHQLISHKREHEARQAAQEEGQANTSDDSYRVSMIHARILNFGSPIPLKNLKANCYGKFVSVKGTVVRVSSIKPLCTYLAFECNSCGTIQCPGEGCRSKTFHPRRSSSQTETIDWQTIRVQEIMGDDQKESGRIPRIVDCELTHDLVDNCVPGDTVTVSGIVKVNSIDEGRSRNKDKCMFLLYIYANSIQNTKGSKAGSEGGVAMDFSMKELYAIEEIQSQENLFRLLVLSLCPSIYGHEMVKAGLILGLFGGSPKFTNDKNRIPVRGDPHILIVGDPGLGKSQMLQSTANIAPRSVYVCGNTTTTAGLTVTLSKDGGSGDYALEAGALVLADQGCCCIDEFDKMGSQHQALLEAMEQQSISIAKAGIVCSLPARTSIIAAANPVGGHYNKAKTVSENLKMGSALLSRFDLVFILLDKPDEEMDNMLSEHVMALHAGSRGITGATAYRQSNEDNLNTSRLLWEADKPLSERLKISRGEPFDPIPHQLLRKFVGYARKYVRPKIGPEAAKVLQDFYLELRKQHHTQDSTPITTRQLESLIRLTEARARLELREVASKEDAEDVIEIMKYSMVETFMDQFGGLDFRRSQHGSGMSGRSQPKRFVAALQKIADQTYNSIFTVQQMRQIAGDIGLHVMDFESFLTSLNNQGYLLKKGPKVYQLQTAGY